MGAWGFGPFENDGAGDLLAGIHHGDFTFDAVEWAFEDADYLEVDGGQIAVALAALVQAANGKLPVPSEIDASQLRTFADQLSPERLAWIQSQLDRALSDGEASELYELERGEAQLPAPPLGALDGDGGAGLGGRHHRAVHRHRHQDVGGHRHPALGERHIGEGLVAQR